MKVFINFKIVKLTDRGASNVPRIPWGMADCRFVVIFVLLHIMVYAFGFMNYSLKVSRPFVFV
jgi:hypothetical protein